MDMASLRETSNEDLMRLSLEAAVEFDRLRCGKDVDEEVIEAFAECVSGTNGTNAPPESLYLNHGPRTLGAYYRAWRTISGSHSETLQGQKARVIELLAEVRDAAKDPHSIIGDQAFQEKLARLERYCLALHQALLAERPSRRRVKRVPDLVGEPSG
jgi:hypothetical protein